MSTPSFPRRGAHPAETGGVRFSVWAPRAREVGVRLESAGGDRETALAALGDGVFEGTVPEARPGSDYVYVLDGGRELADPASRHQPGGVGGPSRVVDPNAFRWSDDGWRGIARPDLVLYELHVGTFTAGGRFEDVIASLRELRELGVTALELMPVAQFPGGRNWGYDGVFPYAPQSTYGGPDGLRSLVDAAHGEGLGVILDVVYNHLGPEGNVLADFGPYFTDRYRTPWGRAINFDGPDSDEVRQYFLDNALHWIGEYHLDGLRLDAVHAIYDCSPRPILAELADRAHALGDRLGRTVHLIAESDANDPRLVSAPERGGHGLDAVWSDDFHHVLHATLTGERSGYYADYGAVAQVAKVLQHRFAYDGDRSAYRRRRHGAKADDVSADRFVVFAQNHDQIGNRAHGDRLSTLVPPADLRLAACLLLLSPYLPLLFMGEEYGETAPFLYFVSHGDPELLTAVREGRRREFSAFHTGAALPDPGAESTFDASRPRRERATQPGHRELLDLHRTLLRIRRELPVLRPGTPRVEVEAPAEAEWLRMDYTASGAPPAFAVFSFGAEDSTVPAPAGDWGLRLFSEDPAFGGAGGAPPKTLSGGGRGLALPGRSAVLYVAASS